MKYTTKMIAAMMILKSYLMACEKGETTTLREIAASLACCPAPDLDTIIVDEITVGDVAFEMAQFAMTGCMENVPELGN